MARVGVKAPEEMKQVGQEAVAPCQTDLRRETVRCDYPSVMGGKHTHMHTHAHTCTHMHTHTHTHTSRHTVTLKPARYHPFLCSDLKKKEAFF